MSSCSCSTSPSTDRLYVGKHLVSSYCAQFWNRHTNFVTLRQTLSTTCSSLLALAANLAAGTCQCRLPSLYRLQTCRPNRGHIADNFLDPTSDQLHTSDMLICPVGSFVDKSGHAPATQGLFYGCCWNANCHRSHAHTSLSHWPSTATATARTETWNRDRNKKRHKRLTSSVWTSRRQLGPWSSFHDVLRICLGVVTSTVVSRASHKPKGLSLCPPCLLLSRVVPSCPQSTAGRHLVRVGCRIPPHCWRMACDPAWSLGVSSAARSFCKTVCLGKRTRRGPLQAGVSFGTASSSLAPTFPSSPPASLPRVKSVLPPATAE